MVPFILLIAVAGGILFTLTRGQRWAPWFLALGVLMFSTLWLMGRWRIPWPDLGLWAVFVLNPYLFLTLSFVLMVAGLVGTAANVLRRFGWFTRET